MLSRSATRLTLQSRTPAQRLAFSSHAHLARYGPRRILIKSPDSKSAADPRGDGIAWKRPADKFYGSLFHNQSNQSNVPPKAEPTLPNSKLVGEEIPIESIPEDISPGSKPLPDLRYGIPHEMPEKSETRTSSKNTAEESESGSKAQSPGSRAGRNSDFPDSAYETSTDRNRNALAKYSFVTFALIATATSMWFGRNWENEDQETAHPDAPSGWSFSLFWARLRARLSNNVDYYTEPTFPKLLPELDPMMGPPSGMTLVLSLEGLMVHNEWTRENGWQTAKRPGLDYFLRYLSQYYEIVLFTTSPMMSAEQILGRLDPYRIITWPLFREATRYDNGDYVKDLSYLNRDLSKVIIVDTNPKHTKFQPENAIILDPWKGTPGDKGLVTLIPFLEYVAAMEVPDVRKVLESFKDRDIPEEFARREAVKRESLRKEAESAATHKKSTKNGGFAWFAGALGIKPMTAIGEPTLSSDDDEPKMLSDIIRERGIKNYELLDKQIREQGEQWLKDLEAEQKKAQEEQMKSMKSSFLSGWLGIGKAKDGDVSEDKSASPETSSPTSSDSASSSTTLNTTAPSSSS